MNKLMSRVEAATVLMAMARGGVSREQCEALQLGVRAIVKRHFDQQKNWAVRRDRRRAAEKGDAGAEPAVDLKGATNDANE